MSEAMCCPLSGSDDADPPLFYRVTRPKASKQYACEECGDAIPRGAVHEAIKAKWRDFSDGKVNTLRTCLLCAEIRDHFACGNGWLFGQLWEDLENNFFPDMRAGGPCMEGLSPEAKGKLVDARMEWYLAQDEVDDSAWEDWAEKRPRP